MKKLLLTAVAGFAFAAIAPAQAADVGRRPVYPPPLVPPRLPPVPVFSWTGCYIAAAPVRAARHSLARTQLKGHEPFPALASTDTGSSCWSMRRWRRCSQESMRRC
jgi:hypothetical protein